MCGISNSDREERDAQSLALPAQDALSEEALRGESKEAETEDGV